MPNTTKTGRQTSAANPRGEHSLKIGGKQSQRSTRKSTRLERIRSRQKPARSREREENPKRAIPTPSTSSVPAEDATQNLPAVQQSTNCRQKRKRSEASGSNERADKAEHPSSNDQSIKRRRTSLPHASNKHVQTQGRLPAPEGRACSNNTHDDNSIEPSVILHWICTRKWPKNHFENDKTWDDLKQDLERDRWLEEVMAKPKPSGVEYVDFKGFKVPRPVQNPPSRKKSSSNLTDSDQKSREAKSAQYKTNAYLLLLDALGIYMDEAEVGITDASKTSYQSLLSLKQAVPENSLFQDNLFKKTCRKVQDRNEARVIQDITRLIVPSAETLATYGAAKLENLIENVNERWTSGIALEGVSTPQPDYSVGFRRSAFTEEQLKKLDPLIGSFSENSYWRATLRMYFPFLSCEVKCGAAALDVADRQNAHSMTLAVRGVVELYKLVKRAKELHREILAYSLSHDHRMVRIYGHYALIDGDKTTFYRHPIHTFDFTALDGKEKWTTYKFTKAVYDWASDELLKRICSAIDDLPPDISFEVSQQPDASQEGAHSQRSLDPEGRSSLPSLIDSQSSFSGSQDVTPTTSFTENAEQGERAFKKPRRKIH